MLRSFQKSGDWWYRGRRNHIQYMSSKCNKTNRGKL
nr:MAG TPA: hypothetical protein [Caudoviricetes sp.]